MAYFGSTLLNPAGMADWEGPPVDFSTAPTGAVIKALESANLDKDDISIFEVNEAFSVVALANAQVRLRGIGGEWWRWRRVIFAASVRLCAYASVHVTRETFVASRSYLSEFCVKCLQC